MFHSRGMTRLAVIGLGHRATAMIASMQAVDPGVSILAVADPDTESARRRLAMVGPGHAGARVYPSADAMLEDPADYDGVVIGTRCHLHTPMAIKVASVGLPLFLEKPVAISLEELGALREAFRGREDEVVVSFPLRHTPLFSKALEVVNSGVLGTVNQIQAVNNVPYGGVYFGQWYRNYDQTGGLWLQKATHDFDCINLLAGSRPVGVAAMESRRVYGGEKPHDLKCSACDETETCPESPQNLIRRGDDGGMYQDSDDRTDHWCAFSREIQNHDAGSALIMYENGIHASYSQNFLSRRAAYRRGATVVGYEATLEFDLAAAQLRLIHHRSEKVEQLRVDTENDGHAGGDLILAESFLDLVKGRAKPNASLKDGLLSAAICLAARESARTNTFQPV
ncbi:Gfo/Idh/MocA family oxidoreductase [soil metagenome]